VWRKTHAATNTNAGGTDGILSFSAPHVRSIGVLSTPAEDLTDPPIEI
jgi:hypothetical protein